MTKQEMEKFTNTYWDSKGNGKYQNDYDRLVDLVPEGGKADTLAGEIMRAVTKLNHNFYTNGTLNNSLDAINFLAMASVFDENDDILATMYPYAKKGMRKDYDCTFNGDEVQMAVEHMVDRAIEFILAYPDLEYAENTIDMSILHETGQIDFMERVLPTHAAAAAAEAQHFQKASTPDKDEPLQEINTPRIANKASDNVAMIQ
mmetsp:Transcript_38467/g.69330  ORF Transcript_38467/g.69330 Transcript_38467/m.69330 type:complete len:203 (+) Transcript_38467:130-738(+)